jgi:DNA-binding response OmpR family regulator
MSEDFSAQVLVVEHEAYVRELVSYTLQGAGYRVRSVCDGESALREMDRTSSDLVVLDIWLPDIDGWEVCRQIRRESNVPIVMISALAEDEAQVRALRLGADDYVLKPFSPLVLAARVQALLRRAAARSTPRLITLKGLTIHLWSHEVRRDGRLVHLTPTEFRILAALARRPGQTLALAEVLQYACAGDRAVRDASWVVKAHIRHLRRKIEPQVGHPLYVLTVGRTGYMLNQGLVVESRE